MNIVDTDAVLKFEREYNSFHDSTVTNVRFVYANGQLNVRVELLNRKHRTDRVIKVNLEIHRVSQFKMSNVTYAILSIEDSIDFFISGNEITVDFAAYPVNSLAKVLSQSDFYFVASQINYEILE